MIYTEEKQGDFTVIRFSEKRLDVLVAQELKNSLLGLLENGVTKLGLDLSNVSFVDSSGLGSLVAVLKKIGSVGSMCMWGLTPEVKSLFELTQLYKVFDIYELEQDALSNS